MRLRPRMSGRFFQSLVVVTALAVGPAIAEDLHVNVNYVDMLDDPSSAGAPVARVKQGDTLAVLEHDGRWVKVQHGTDVGYVNQKALTADAVAPALDMGPSDNSTAMNTGAAGRGFDETDYAKAKGYDPAALENLIALSKKLVKPADLRAFDASGNVGANRGGR